MPLRRTYKPRNNNPQYDPVTQQNVRHQASQLVNQDVQINAPQQDGDTVIWGNWSWSSPNAVDALSKIAAVTDIDDTQYYSIPNFREIHRSNAGAFASGVGSGITTGGFNIFGGGFTQAYNYINANSFDAGGTLTIQDTGVYLIEISGSVIATGGAITNMVGAFRVGAASYSTSGGSRVAYPAAAGVTQAPYFLKWVLTLNAAQSIRPATFATVSAGTLALDTCLWRIEPLYFV